MPEDTSFPRLVSLAAHDLRTPLATVNGFAKTLVRQDELADPAARYVAMIDAAAEQMAELLDELGLAARITAGRYEPVVREVETAALAEAARAHLGSERVGVSGDGGAVRVDPEPTERAVTAFANCALRHGGIDHVDVVATADGVTVAPIVPSAAAIVLGDDLRDLPAAVGVRVVRALGGNVELDGETLLVVLPC